MRVRVKVSVAAALCLLMAGCGVDPVEKDKDAAEGDQTNPGKLTLLTADGTDGGMVTVSEDATGLTIRIEAVGLEPGPHGVHLHTVGRCDAPSFESAGPHWNPTAKQHGRDNREGAHLGDLANLEAGPDGRATTTFGMPGVQLRAGELPLVDLDGAALIIHARADDYKTDPSGASGDRILCAALEG